MTFAKTGNDHVSEWIHRFKVDISVNYIREDREGGLDAVGQGFPGIPRSDLMTLPDDEWKREQDLLIYEAWARRATQAERAQTAQ